MKFKTKEASVDVGLIDQRHCGPIIGGLGDTQVAVINDRGKVFAMSFDQLDAFFFPADGDAEAFMDGAKQRAEQEKKMMGAMRRPFPPPDFTMGSPTPEGWDVEYKTDEDSDPVRLKMRPIPPEKKR